MVNATSCLIITKLIETHFQIEVNYIIFPLDASLFSPNTFIIDYSFNNKIWQGTV